MISNAEELFGNTLFGADINQACFFFSLTTVGGGGELKNLNAQKFNDTDTAQVTIQQDVLISPSDWW